MYEVPSKYSDQREVWSCKRKAPKENIHPTVMPILAISIHRNKLKCTKNRHSYHENISVCTCYIKTRNT